MSWFSILPSDWTNVEAWLTRFFLMLALLTIGPWVVILAYDVLLYILRFIMYEIPVVGGRARGRQRPTAPSLTERPDGERRDLSLPRAPLPNVPEVVEDAILNKAMETPEGTSSEDDGPRRRSPNNED